MYNQHDKMGPALFLRNSFTNMSCFRTVIRTQNKPEIMSLFLPSHRLIRYACSLFQIVQLH